MHNAAAPGNQRNGAGDFALVNVAFEQCVYAFEPLGGKPNILRIRFR
jgi:hypothetical protein